MKKIIARGASLFLMTLVVFTLVLSTCYAAEVNTGKKWTIENNVEGALITIDTNYEEYTVTIKNNAKENVDNVFAKITVGGHTEKTDFFELTGLSSVTINLKDYFAEESLNNQEVKFSLEDKLITRVSISFILLMVVAGIAIFALLVKLIACLLERAASKELHK